MALPKGWLTVEVAGKLPEPDTFWMSEPGSRSDFTGWMGLPPGESDAAVLPLRRFATFKYGGEGEDEPFTSRLAYLTVQSLSRRNGNLGKTASPRRAIDPHPVTVLASGQSSSRPRLDFQAADLLGQG